VYEIANPFAESLGLYVYDVEYVKEGAFWFVRVFVDREETGATLDDCEAVSRQIGDALDKKDPIPQNYYLEVATPGIDRKLRHEEHFRRYCGREVDVGLYTNAEIIMQNAEIKGKQLTGTLVGYENGIILLNYKNENIQFNLKDTTQVRLSFDFTELGGHNKK